MPEEKIKDGLCLPSEYNSEVEIRQMVALNLTKNNVHECLQLRGGFCTRYKINCLPNNGNFSSVELLP